MANLLQKVLDIIPYDLDINTSFRDWLEVLYRHIGEIEGLHEIGTVGEPVFQNAWVNVGAPYENAGFYIDSFKRVYLRGVIGTGALTTVAFTLPVGYRPDNTVRFNGAVSVDNLGQVVPILNGDLDGISFRVS